MEAFNVITEIVRAVREWRSQNPKEDDKNQLLKNVKKYHERLKKACERGTKVVRLASDIRKDNLLSLVIGEDNVEKILEKINSIDTLSKRQVKIKRQLCKEVLQIFTKIYKEI